MLCHSPVLSAENQRHPQQSNLATQDHAERITPITRAAFKKKNELIGTTSNSLFKNDFQHNYFMVNNDVDSMLVVTIPENQIVLFPGGSGSLYSSVSSLVYLLGK